MDSPSLDVLIVEDDDAARAVLAHHLGAERWSVRAVADGAAALEAVRERAPDVVVLDVMLPGACGLEICAALRALSSPSPGVLMLTARDGEADVILGFDSGADDYVVKPCRPREIIARVRALGRRVGQSSRPPPDARDEDRAVVHGALHIDPRARRALVADKALRLTPKEFELLVLLASEPSRVHSRVDLLERVWDSTHAGYARNVDCHVTRLRRKLEAAGLCPAPIETVHGTGYRFVPPGGA
jgi:DNA-binding response OmpR family regulator